MSICLIIFLPFCYAMIEKNQEISISTHEEFTIVWSFEFAVGGELDMTIKLQNSGGATRVNHSIQFLLCTDAEIEPLRNAQFSDVCAKPRFDYVQCKWQENMGLGHDMKTRHKLIADSRDWYRLLQLNCKKDTYLGSYDLTAINPGGEYLSLAEVPYKMLFLVAIVAWSLLLVAWCANWLRYRFFNIKLQRAITSVPFIQIAVSIASMFYWRERSSTGYEPEALYITMFMLSCLSKGIFFICLVFIGKGWGITRNQLGTQELKRIWGMIILLMVAQGVYSKFKGFLLFFLVIMYVLILRYIFASIVENSSTLHTQHQLVRNLNVTNNSSPTPVSIKLQMFKKFQVAMVIYISVDVIFHLWATIFLQSTPWIEDMMEHAITALMAIGVGVALHLRPFNPNFYRIVGDGSEASDFVSSGPCEFNAMYQLWQPGMSVPPILDADNPWKMGLESRPIYLIENPLNPNASRTIKNVVIAKPLYHETPSLIPSPFPMEPIHHINSTPLSDMVARSLPSGYCGGETVRNNFVIKHDGNSNECESAILLA